MKKRFLLWCAYSVLLASCGFALRGTVSHIQWLSPLLIVSETLTPSTQDIIPLLTNHFETNHVHVVGRATEARYILTLEKADFERVIMSVSASTTPRQYQLIYTLTYSLTPTKGQAVITSNKLTVVRQYTMNNDRILGSDFEEATIQKEMQKDAAIQLLMRVDKQSQHVHQA